MSKRLGMSGILIMLLVAKTSAQIFGSISGELPSAFMTGSNLFNNPLESFSGVNDLHELFPTAPEGTSVSLWNSATSSFDTTSIFTNGFWSTDLILPPGTGALLITPVSFTNTIGGYVLNRKGGFFEDDLLTRPPLFSGPNGIYLLGDKTPLPDTGTNIFLNLIGREPFPGEKVTQLSGTSTYLGNGLWDSIPILEVGQAAFLTIISEPSPVLTIVYGQNQVIVSWPSSVSGWTLQTGGNPAGTWENYPGPVVNNSITNSLPGRNTFFRLSYP